MAAQSLDRYSPSRFLEHAEALVNEGMANGIQKTLTGLTQVGSGVVCGFGMTTWGDKAYIAGLPLDALAGAAFVAAGATGLGGEVSEYLVAAGLGALTAAGTRLGQEAALSRMDKAAKSRAGVPPQ